MSYVSQCWEISPEGDGGSFEGSFVLVGTVHYSVGWYCLNTNCKLPYKVNEDDHWHLIGL